MNRELSAGTKDEQRTTADNSTSASLEQNGLLAESPVRIKLLTLWMMDKEFLQRDPSTHFISCGIWQTQSVFYDVDDNRAYEFVCVWPMHKDLKFGDTRKMYEETILHMCHQIEITHLPKIVV
jgi:hypothetical protein